MSNNLVNLLQYLANLHSNGYATRTVYVQRSMLSMTLDPLDGRNIGEHPMVIQLMKGCYNANPPRPRYDSTWDPAVVLDFLAILGNDRSFDLVQLSVKLVTLLALATLMRTAELASISSSSVSFTSTRVSFFFLDLEKSKLLALSSPSLSLL